MPDGERNTQRPHIYFRLEIGGKIAARTKPRLCYTFSFALRTLDRGPGFGSGQNKGSSGAVAVALGGQAWCLRLAAAPRRGRGREAVVEVAAAAAVAVFVCVNAWRKMCEDDGKHERVRKIERRSLSE